MIRNPLSVLWVLVFGIHSVVCAGDVVFLEYEAVPQLHRSFFAPRQVFICGTVGEFEHGRNRGIIIDQDGEVLAVPGRYTHTRQISKELVLVSRGPMYGGLPHRVLVGDEKHISLETELFPRVMSNGMVFFAQSSGIFPVSGGVEHNHPIDTGRRRQSPMLFLTPDLEIIHSIDQELGVKTGYDRALRRFVTLVDYLPETSTPLYQASEYGYSGDAFRPGLVILGEERVPYYLLKFGEHHRYCAAELQEEYKYSPRPKFIYDSHTNSIVRPIEGEYFWKNGWSYLMLESDGHWVLMNESFEALVELDAGWKPWVLTDEGILVLRSQEQVGGENVERFRACRVEEDDFGVRLKQTELDWKGVRASYIDRNGFATRISIVDRDGVKKQLNGRLGQGRRVADRKLQNGNVLSWLGPNSYALLSPDGEVLKQINVAETLDKYPQQQSSNTREPGVLQYQRLPSD